MLIGGGGEPARADFEPLYYKEAFALSLPNFLIFNDGIKYSNDDEKRNSISSIGLASITSLDVLKIKAADVNHPH